MKDILKQNGKKVLIIGILSIFVAFIFEIILICSSETVYMYDEKSGATILYPNELYEMYPISYEVEDNNVFIPQNEDPQLVFPEVNSEMEGVLIELGSILEAETMVQVYYATSEHSFSEEHVVIECIEEGKGQIYIDMPYSECTALRVDINGTAHISNIVMLDNDLIKSNSLKSRQFEISEVMLFTLLVFAGVLFLEKYRRMSRTEYSLSKLELAYCLFCFCFYFLWAISKPFNYGPDEYMRYDVSLFLYNHNRLPRGIETINPMWGFSYAHLPTMLCNILSYIPMKIVGFFSQNEFSLVVAARMVSVCCGVGVVYFVIKISKCLMKTPARWIMIIFVSMIPQFVFLCSYLNNDVVALLGSSVILYAWVRAMEEHWNKKVAILLSIGIMICALAYYNSYGWILCSIVFFVVTYLLQYRKDYAGMMKLGIVISVIVLTGISYFFIRHLVLYGDLLGFNTISEYGELYAIESLKKSNRITLQSLEVSLWDMLFGNYKWMKSTYQSSIGFFGYMNVPLSEYVYTTYACLIGICGICGIWNLYQYIKGKQFNGTVILFYCCNVICIILPIVLSIFNSYCSDFQPQGRYCYPGILAAALVLAKGADSLMKKVRQKEYAYACIGIYAGGLIAITMSEFFITYLPS